MLRKNARLTARDIERLKDGKSVFGTLVSVRALPMPELKVSVASSRKIASRAVSRNRARRRVYAALRKVLPGIHRGAYVLIMPRNECLRAPFPAIIADLQAVFAKAKLLS